MFIFFASPRTPMFSFLFFSFLVRVLLVVGGWRFFAYFWTLLVTYLTLTFLINCKIRFFLVSQFICMSGPCLETFVIHDSVSSHRWRPITILLCFRDPWASVALSIYWFFFLSFFCFFHTYVLDISTLNPISSSLPLSLFLSLSLSLSHTHTHAHTHTHTHPHTRAYIHSVSFIIFQPLLPPFLFNITSFGFVTNCFHSARFTTFFQSFKNVSFSFVFLGLFLLFILSLFFDYLFVSFLFALLFYKRFYFPKIIQ